MQKYIVCIFYLFRQTIKTVNRAADLVHSTHRSNRLNILQSQTHVLYRMKVVLTSRAEQDWSHSSRRGRAVGIAACDSEAAMRHSAVIQKVPKVSH